MTPPTIEDQLAAALQRIDDLENRVQALAGRVQQLDQELHMPGSHYPLGVQK
jgi:division protein CdvB (Snf7/Vps24/ESCRT-III family)